MRDVAALFVEKDGPYFGLDGVHPWDESMDARKYDGVYPVVAHPPCQRWGRFWHGSPRKPHQYQLGDDGGCFESALTSVKRWGGVLEHPANSRAFAAYGIMAPKIGEGWVLDCVSGFCVCWVEQGNYGHFSRKSTWLAARGIPLARLPNLKWERGEQKLPGWMIERYGYEKARRIGVMAMCGGRRKAEIRAATPREFRDVLIDIARSVGEF